ncbi:MAG TPA: hypothetical protein VJT16_16245 [Streptosporangiaceae bacterium]|jgi:hypothetical protein|nr:hypothetical protein [Streptosporangiaceae bacterium]
MRRESADVILDALAVRGVYQTPSPKRCAQPDAHNDYRDNFDMAVAGIAIDQAQRDPMPIRAHDQQRAMTARLCRPQGDDSSILADGNRQPDSRVARRSGELLKTAS